MLLQCAADVNDERVQELLRRISGMDMDVVFAPRKEPLTPPHYKLMTREQLKKVFPYYFISPLFSIQKADKIAMV